MIGGDPDLVAVRIFGPWLVIEVFAEKAELPQLICDVFADIGNCTVGADDDFAFVDVFGFIAGDCAFAKGGRRHDPTALVLALVFEEDGLAFLEQFKGGGPELKVENFTFAGQDIVFDIETEHGFQVRFDDGVGDDVTKFGEIALTGFDGVEGIGAPGFGFGVLAVIRGGAGIEIPAEVIEARVGIGDECAHIGGRFLFKIVKAYDDVGYLDAGVIDVVLHFDLAAAVAEHADESVAQDGVTQVADVGGFVGVDVGVFDDDFATRRRGRFPALLSQKLFGIFGAVETDIDISVARDLKRGYAGHVGKAAGEFFGNLLGRTLELARELERHRNG